MAAEQTTRYGYYSQGDFAEILNRETRRRFSDPGMLIGPLAIGVCMGVALVLLVPQVDLGGSQTQDVAVGAFLGLVWGVVVLLLALAAALFFGRRLNAAFAHGVYPTGSVSEFLLDDGALTIRRLGSSVTIPYARITRVRRRSGLVTLTVRGSNAPELLPASALPDGVIEQAVERAKERPNSAVRPMWGTPDATMVVPPRWPRRVAAAALGSRLRTGVVPGALIVLLIETVVVSLLAHSVIPLVVLAVCVALLLCQTFVRARRSYAILLPPGSSAFAYHLADRIVLVNAGGMREVMLSSIRSVRARGDFVTLSLDSAPRELLVARALLPEHLVAEGAR